MFASIYYLPFVLVSVLLFSLPMLVVYVWIPMFLMLTVFIVTITFLITFTCLENHTSCLQQNMEYYTNIYIKYTIGILKRVIPSFIIVILYNYAIVLYQENDYTTPILEDYYARNSSVYYQCMVVDKFYSHDTNMNYKIWKTELMPES